MSEAATALAETPSDSGLDVRRLDDALGVFELVIDRRNTVAALSCVDLCADGATLTISGTDLDHQLTCRLPYAGVKFRALVKLHALCAAVQSFDEMPAISVTQNKLTLTRLPTMISLDTLPPDELPELTRIQPAATFEADATLLLERLLCCRPAISREETRYYLMGISLRKMPDVDGIECAATDGHRLHVTRFATMIDGEMPEVILQSKAVRILTNLLGKPCEHPVVVEVSPTRLAFLIDDDWTLESKPIDGTFPDYRRVTPELLDNGASLAFPVEEMLATLRAIERIDGAEMKRGKLDLKAMTVEFVPENRDVRYSRGITGTVTGEPPEAVGFNPRYLAQLLGVRPKGQAQMYFGATAEMPLRIEFEGDGSFVGVLMPMKV